MSHHLFRIFALTIAIGIGLSVQSFSFDMPSQDKARIAQDNTEPFKIGS